MLLLSPDPDICTSCTWICICICICVRICFWNLLQLLVAGCLRVVAASGVDDLPAGCWRGKEVELERHPTKTQAKTTSTFYIHRVVIRSARVAQNAKDLENAFVFFQDFPLSVSMSALPLITSSLITWYSRINESETATVINFISYWIFQFVINDQNRHQRFDRYNIYFFHSYVFKSIIYYS